MFWFFLTYFCSAGDETQAPLAHDVFLSQVDLASPETLTPVSPCLCHRIHQTGMGQRVSEEGLGRRGSEALHWGASTCAYQGCRLPRLFIGALVYSVHRPEMGLLLHDFPNGCRHLHVTSCVGSDPQM